MKMNRQDVIQVRMEHGNVGGRDKKGSIVLFSDPTQIPFTLSSIWRCFPQKWQKIKREIRSVSLCLGYELYIFYFFLTYYTDKNYDTFRGLI